MLYFPVGLLTEGNHGASSLLFLSLVCVNKQVGLLNYQAANSQRSAGIKQYNGSDSGYIIGSFKNSGQALRFFFFFNSNFMSAALA